MTLLRTWTCDLMTSQDSAAWIISSTSTYDLMFSQDLAAWIISATSTHVLPPTRPLRAPPPPNLGFVMHVYSCPLQSGLSSCVLFFSKRLSWDILSVGSSHGYHNIDWLSPPSVLVLSVLLSHMCLVWNSIDRLLIPQSVMLAVFSVMLSWHYGYRPLPTFQILNLSSSGKFFQLLNCYLSSARPSVMSFHPVT
jgi:hypothetical protein